MDNSKTKTELPVGFLFSNSKRTIEIENQGLTGGRSFCQHLRREIHRDNELVIYISLIYLPTYLPT